jgi:hypothetical protein
MESLMRRGLMWHITFCNKKLNPRWRLHKKITIVKMNKMYMKMTSPTVTATIFDVIVIK